MSGGFDAYGLSPELLSSIYTDTDWLLPTAIQDEAIPLIMGGGDVLASAETGSGKTGAFALPIIQLCLEHYQNPPVPSIIHSKKKHTNKHPIPFTLSQTDRSPSIVISSSLLTLQTRSPTWSGIRSTSGVATGLHAFTTTCRDEGIVRIGVSTLQSNLELGKDDYSIGYGGTGMKVTGNKFEKYGCVFTKGDTIITTINLTVPATLTVSFTVNAIPHPTITIPIPPNTVFYPHVCLKNAECELDFTPFSITAATSYHPNTTLPAPPPPLTANTGPLAIILEPVRDLAEQTYNAFASLSSSITSHPIKTALLTGGISPKNTLDALRNNQVDILVGTVPIIQEFIKQKKIPTGRTRFYVLDEADQLTGVDNVENVIKIYESLPLRHGSGVERLQVCLFSATLHSKGVRDLVAKICERPTWVDLKGKESVPDTVHHCVVKVSSGTSDTQGRVNTDGVHHEYGKLEGKIEVETMTDADKRSQKIKELKPHILLQVIERFKMEQVLVFCRTNLDCDLLEKFLKGDKEKSDMTVSRYSCCVLAGMRTMQERRANLAKFKEGGIRILIATDVAARGIDIQGLPFVVNMTMPDMSENYVHRVGRVGRAERMGLAVSLVSTVKERVWYCQNKKKPPQFDRR